jgi:ribosomal protein L37AE/L43A
MPVETFTCLDCGSHDVKIEGGIVKCARCGSTNLEKSPIFPFMA